MRFSRSRCPTRGAILKLDMVITAVAMSNLPNEMVHCRVPINDWYWEIPLLIQQICIVDFWMVTLLDW